MTLASNQISGPQAPRAGGRAGGRVALTNFDLQHMQIRAVSGFEQKVEDLRPLWLRVIDQQAAVSSSGQRAMAVILTSRAIRIDLGQQTSAAAAHWHCCREGDRQEKRTQW